MALYLKKRAEVCLWKWISEGSQFVSYSEMLQGKLSEIEKKILTPDKEWCISSLLS